MNIDLYHKLIAFFNLIQNLQEKRNGVPQFLYSEQINLKGSLEVRKAIINYKRAKGTTQEIDFIIHSPGGSADDAYRIIKILKSNFHTVNIIVPLFAKSAATLLALGGDRIVLDNFAELGPLDVQLRKEVDEGLEERQESALVDEVSLERIEFRAHKFFLEIFTSCFSSSEIPIKRNVLIKEILGYISQFYSPLLDKINPYELGQKKRNLDIGTEYGKRILEQYSNLDESVIRELIDFLVNRCPDHGYIVDKGLMDKYLKDRICSPALFVSPEYEEILEDAVSAFIEILLEKREDFPFIGFINDELIGSLKQVVDQNEIMQHIPKTDGNDNNISNNGVDSENSISSDDPPEIKKTKNK